MIKYILPEKILASLYLYYQKEKSYSVNLEWMEFQANSARFKMHRYIRLKGWLSGKESKCNAGDPGLILGEEDSLEKGVAAHFSILTWRIPWTEESGGLQSMGS